MQSGLLLITCMFENTSGSGRILSFVHLKMRNYTLVWFRQPWFYTSGEAFTVWGFSFVICREKWIVPFFQGLWGSNKLIMRDSLSGGKSVDSVLELDPQISNPALPPTPLSGCWQWDLGQISFPLCASLSSFVKWVNYNSYLIII